MDSNKPPSDAVPVAEATEVIAANVMRLLDVDGSPSTDLLNLLAGYGIRCEQDGFGDGRLELKLETMEFKIGLIPDRRKAATPVADYWLEEVNGPHVSREKLHRQEPADVEVTDGYTRTVTALYAHPDDAPRPDKASQGSTDSGGVRPEQVEDAPGGPWETFISVSYKLAAELDRDVFQSRVFACVSKHPYVWPGGLYKRWKEALGHLKGGET